MFGAISKLFGKRPAPATRETAPSPAPPTISRAPSKPAAAPAPAPRVSKLETPAVPVVATQPTPRTGPQPGSRPFGPFGPGEEIRIPFASVLRGVPQDLWGKLAPAGAAGKHLVLAKSDVIAQLPQGAVKLPLATLRQSAPDGLFAANAARDSQLIDLPLKDILEQLRLESLARRPDQTPIHVSAEVPDIFGARGENLSTLRIMEKAEASAGRKVAPAPEPRPAAPEPPPAWAPLPMTPAASAPAAPGPLPPRSVTPVAPPSVQQPPVHRPATPPPQAAPAPAPATGLAPVAPIRFGPPPAPAPAPAAPLRPAPLAPTAAPPAGTFLIAIKDVAERWPEEIRTALAQLQVGDGKLALPAVEVCEGLKRRRVEFPWDTLRAWIFPTPPPTAPSALDKIVLTLPLDQLTPLFLDFIRSSPAHRKVADSRTITEFFRRAELEAKGAAPSPSNVIPLPVPGPGAETPETPPLLEGSIDLPLGPISTDWPAEVRGDIGDYQLNQSVVSLPLEYVEAGLKGGRVEFSWRQVLAWLRPIPTDAQNTQHGELRVCFPLPVVAPLFLRKTGANQPRRKAAVDQSIPDLFSAHGVPNPAATAPVPVPPAAPARPPAPVPAAATTAPSTPPAPAPSPVVPVPSSVAPEAAAVPRLTPRNLAQVFNEPGKRTWTPNDIVHYSARLPGVAGALIALQDGLLVAAAMPPTLRGETIAAFVPQIFGRMNQYTRELQLGEAQGISYTVPSGTLQMYSAGLIYYVILGKPDAPLPLQDLQFIARELSRHTK